MERLDLDGLHALIAISKAGGVTRAAEMLSLSQPAVSHKIKRLEQVLGCDLLMRRSGGPLFTQAGEQLLSYANQMLDLSVVHILKPKSECHFKKPCLQEVEQGINARRQLANASTNTASLQTVIRAS